MMFVWKMSAAVILRWCGFGAPVLVFIAAQEKENGGFGVRG
jgi:hypothetical protein